MEAGNVSLCRGPATGVTGQLTFAALAPDGSAVGWAGTGAAAGLLAGAELLVTGLGELDGCRLAVLAAAVHPHTASTAHPIRTQATAPRWGHRGLAAAL